MVHKDLTIGGIIFPTELFTQSHGTQQSYIDISNLWTKLLLDIRAFRGADIATDHNLVLGHGRLNKLSEKQANIQYRFKKDS